MNRIVFVELVKTETKYKLRSEMIGDAFGTGCDDEGLFPTYSVMYRDVKIPYNLFTFKITYENGRVKFRTYQEGTPKWIELMGYIERQNANMQNPNTQNDCMQNTAANTNPKPYEPYGKKS
ncbi:MAG: hypothetical protein K6B15_09720 [Parasporobacterium sp.]|nr:hypothetical protein [Parasporobacterium sp.]